MSQQTPAYTESVRAEWWLYSFLALLFGGTTGALTGVAITGSIEGAEAAVFYITFALSALTSVFVIVNFTNLDIAIDDRGLSFSFGMFRRSFDWSSITDAQAEPYRWVRFGGWGIRLGTGRRRAWSMLFVRTGVNVTVQSGGRTMEYYLSSRRPEEMARALQAGVRAAQPVAGATAVDDASPEQPAN